MEQKNAKNLLFPELSYQLVGCAFNVHKTFGIGHKESLYQEAFERELTKANIKFLREPVIAVVDFVSGQKLNSNYRPDFLIDDKIIVEIKAVNKPTQFFVSQLYTYLHNSGYELGYLINFAERYIKPIRVVYSNQQKCRQIAA